MYSYFFYFIIDYYPYLVRKFLLYTTLLRSVYSVPRLYGQWSSNRLLLLSTLDRTWPVKNSRRAMLYTMLYMVLYTAWRRRFLHSVLSTECWNVIRICVRLVLLETVHTFKSFFVSVVYFIMIVCYFFTFLSSECDDCVCSN